MGIHFITVSEAEVVTITVWAGLFPSRASEGGSGPGLPLTAGVLLVMLGVLDT